MKRQAQNLTHHRGIGDAPTNCKINYKINYYYLFNINSYFYYYYQY